MMREDLPMIVYQRFRTSTMKNKERILSPPSQKFLNTVLGLSA